jgi:hypothetical protein
MSAVPPTISYSTPGVPASQAAADALVATKIPGMYKEQAFKNNGQTQRFSLSFLNNTTIKTFTAHLDPSDISYRQQKRIASLDALTGVVLQDFGFKAPILEVKGTTGSAYYTEIDAMNTIFNNQNIGNPTPVNIVLENKNYTAVWTEFSYSRMINAQAGNIIQYAMSFTILSNSGVAAANTDTIAANSAVAASNAAANSFQYTNGTSSSTQINWSGSMLDYVRQNSFSRNQDQVINYLQTNWNTAQGPVPRPNIPIPANSTLTVPTDWSTIILSGTPTSMNNVA